MSERKVVPAMNNPTELQRIISLACSVFEHYLEPDPSFNGYLLAQPKHANAQDSNSSEDDCEQKVG